jgi:integrase
VASIETVKQKNLTRYVVRFRRFGAAHKISLDSDYTRRDAERLRDAVTAALRAEKLGEPLDRATNLYFDSAPPDLRRRLIKANLLRGAASLRLAEAIDRFLHEYCATSKPSTVDNYKQSFNILTDAVGGERPLEMITRDHLLSVVDKMRTVYKLSTLQGHCSCLKAFFGWYVKREVLDKTPFIDIDVGARAVGEKVYVPASDVIKCFPFLTLERRAILALWIFAGLRREEPSFLTRECVDLVNRRLTVFSPKTERHAGRDRRITPSCATLAPILAEYMETTSGAPGDKLVAKQLHGYPLDGARKRAGVWWPRRAQNLRVSCENDWLEQNIPAHVVASWIGHTVGVQSRHYAIVLDSYFKRVTETE